MARCQHWLDDGPTSKSNTVLVCHRHRVALHEGGFRAERRDDGSLVFYDPGGRPLDSTLGPPELPDAGETILRNAARARGLRIDHRINLVQYNGEGFDLHAAVDALFTVPQLRGEARLE